VVFSATLRHNFNEASMKTRLLFFAIAAFVVGCASHTGIVPIGKDSYMLAKQQSTGFSGLGNIKAEIITEGRLYCANENKEFQLMSASETQPPYVFGNYPRAEIQFLCIAK
jgi:hypothetical protein